MSKKTKNLVLNLTLFFIVFLISLALAEILLRLLLPQNLNYTAFDGNLMYKHIPSLEFKYFRQEFSNTIKFNSKGLRDYEYEYKKNSNVQRVLILGDSFPEALQVSLNETFAKILEQKLSNKGKNYEVINAGTGGYGTENELLFFEFEGIKYSPNFVLLAFAPNDIDDNLLSPLISIENGKLAKNIPVKASLPKIAMLQCSRYLHLCSLAQKVLLQGLKENEFVRVIFDKLRISSNGNSKKVTSKPGQDIYLKKESEIFKKGLNEAFLIISELDKAMKKNNIKFAILLIPSREQVDEGMYRKFLQKHNLNERDIDIAKLQKLVGEFAESNGITILNPLDYLRERNANNSFYFNVDGHFNREGHKQIAEFLYKNIEERKLLG